MLNLSPLCIYCSRREAWYCALRQNANTTAWGRRLFQPPSNCSTFIGDFNPQLVLLKFASLSSSNRCGHKGILSWDDDVTFQKKTPLTRLLVSELCGRFLHVGGLLWSVLPSFCPLGGAVVSVLRCDCNQQCISESCTSNRLTCRVIPGMGQHRCLSCFWIIPDISSEKRF